MTSSTIVSCTNLDSIRIEVMGEGRAVTIPAALLLAADRVMRHCLIHDGSLRLLRASDGSFWWGTIDEQQSPRPQEHALSAPTPWEALLRLAETL